MSLIEPIKGDRLSSKLRQPHKTDYMLFANAIKRILSTK